VLGRLSFNPTLWRGAAGIEWEEWHLEKLVRIGRQWVCSVAHEMPTDVYSPDAVRMAAK